MTRLLTVKKTSSRKTFLIRDQGNLVKIKQPDIMDVAFLYGVLLEKINKSKYH